MENWLVMYLEEKQQKAKFIECLFYHNILSLSMELIKLGNMQLSFVL